MAVVPGWDPHPQRLFPEEGYPTYVTFHEMFAVEKYKASISSMSKVLMKEVKLIRFGSVRKGGKRHLDKCQQ